MYLLNSARLPSAILPPAILPSAILPPVMLPPAVLLFLILSACAGTPAAQSPASTQSPRWINNASTVYPEGEYIAAVGYGMDRGGADKSALGNLAAVFGQAVKGEITASYKYSEAVSGGLIDMRERSEIDSAVKTSYNLETLVGAEIKERWFDGKDTYYAVAVMDKNRGTLLYRELIQSNETLIQKLTGLPGAERDTFAAYARYELAGTIADANRVFSGVLSVLNPAAALLPDARSGEEYRLIAREIAGAIPVQVKVENDRLGRVGAAFAAVFSAAGFKTGGENSRYTLDVSFTLTEVAFSQNQNKYVRYTVDAQLRDTRTNQTLFPYNISDRVGHLTIQEAENRALRAVETQIGETFAAQLTAYMAQLAATK
ncbi:MAG: LPP20 family lipoprotein [Treponema sp.]|jgi:hypothetical protein|nr:LPP20 family lipoprotein [Treponema sp.]